MQHLYNCIHHTPNDNLNKTCCNNKRCLLISYEHKCRDYDDTKDCTTCKHAHLESFYMVCDIDGVVDKCVENCKNWQI